MRVTINNPLLSDTKTRLANTVAHLHDELKKVRTNRPSSALIEDARVEAYGQIYKLKDLANIALEPPRVLKIEPWDKSILKQIEKGVGSLAIGGAVSSSEGCVLVKLPELSEETRKDLERLVSQLAEQSRRAARACRDATIREFQDKKRAGEISEDQMFRLKQDLQKLIDETNTGIESAVRAKSADIMT